MTDNMDSGAIIRRAHERGEQAQTYDPEQLVVEVAQLLRERGLQPDDRGRAGMAGGGAGMMLRAMGVVPASDYRVIDRVNAPDPDSR